MSLYGGSVSFVRYRVLGLKKSYKLADLNTNLAPYQAKRLKLLGTHKEEAYGWVKPHGIGDEDEDAGPHWDISDCQFEDGYLLRFRLDRRRVPTALLQMIFKDRIKKKNSTRQKPMGARERKQLLLDTKMELLESCLPTVAFEDCFWQANTGQVFLFGVGKKSQQIFEDLFYKTFCEPLGLTLVKQDPPLLGLADETWQDIDSLSDFVHTLSTTVPVTLADGIH